jgi:hypothetical protein
MLTNVTIRCSCFVLEKNSSEFFPFLAALSIWWAGMCWPLLCAEGLFLFRDDRFEHSYLLTTHLCAQQLISLLVYHPVPYMATYLPSC